MMLAVVMFIAMLPVFVWVIFEVRDQAKKEKNRK
jgi:hypothetical protein